MECQSCGAQVGAEDLNCPSCGEPIGAFEKTVMRSAKSLEPLPPAAELLDGKWEIGPELGHGGMGTVFAATDVELDRRVAIKMLSPALVKEPEVVTRFEREAKMLARLEHPNLVPIYAVGRKDGLPFIVMKHLEGNTLAGHLREKVRLTADEFLSIARQLCAGIGFIHTKGIIHRDIKPGNVFVSPEGHVTILDLGVAHDSKNQLTKTGLLIGTPRYMSPEQILYGSGRIDHRSDLYALATVLFETLTGAPVFDAETDFSVMRAHTDLPPPDASTIAPDIPPSVGAVLSRALAKDPKDRYSTAAELYAALEAAWTGVEVAPDPSFATNPGMPERRSPTNRPPTQGSAIAAGRPRTPAVTSGSAIAQRPRTPAVTGASATARPGPRTPGVVPHTNAGTMRPQRRPGGTPSPSSVVRARPAGGVDEELGATDPAAHPAQPPSELEDVAAIRGGAPKGVLIAVGVVVLLLAGGAGVFFALRDDPSNIPVPKPLTATKDDGTEIDPGAHGASGPVAATGKVADTGATKDPVDAPTKKDPAGDVVAAVANTTAATTATQADAKDDGDEAAGADDDKPSHVKATGSRSRGTRARSHDTGTRTTTARRDPDDSDDRADKPSEVRVITTYNGASSWAWLDVDGVRKGTTPSILKLSPGSYKLRFSRPGYQTFEKKITVMAGQPLRVPVELQK